MTQDQLDRAVARATGESRRVIRSRGFCLADPDPIGFDPDGQTQPPSIVDWDEIDLGRASLFP